jgi:hypothetical protein
MVVMVAHAAEPSIGAGFERATIDVFMVAGWWPDGGPNWKGAEMAVTEINDWDGLEGQTVTVVDTPEVASFLGVERDGLRRRLRELRDAGKLVHDTKRLTKRRRIEGPNGTRHVRCVVFKGQRRDFEKPRGRAKLLYWQ